MPQNREQRTRSNSKKRQPNNSKNTKKQKDKNRKSNHQKYKMNQYVTKLSKLSITKKNSHILIFKNANNTPILSWYLDNFTIEDRKGKKMKRRLNTDQKTQNKSQNMFPKTYVGNTYKPAYRKGLKLNIAFRP